MKPGQTVAWLSAEQAAVHLGYVHADGTPNLPAFYQWKHREKPRAFRLRGRLRFRQADLDRCLEPEPQVVAAVPLRMVSR